MCGIIGYIGSHQAVPILLDGLRKLEYRGYDSAGLAVAGSGGIQILRAAGKLSNLEEKAYGTAMPGMTGIGHTRWATHGAPTEANAHPQVDTAGRLAIVHNGILENYASLRAELRAAGTELTSDTDTELIAQLLGREEGPLLDRVLRILPRLEGQYAVVAISADEPGELVAFRQGPPLVIGVGDGEMLVASDVTALLSRTRRVIFLEHGDVARLSLDQVTVFDGAGRKVERAVETLDWDAARAEKGGYRHFMLKEIHEQPDAVRNTVLAYLDQDRRGVNIEGFGLDPGRLQKIQRVQLVACGTSWHACLVGKFYIERLAQIPVDVDYASEYRYREPLLGEDTLLIGVTQSGETADTLAAMELGKHAGAPLATVCNVRNSSAWRLAEARLLTQAGPEIGVASTKAFTTQLVALLLTALALRKIRGFEDDVDVRLAAQLQRLPLALAKTLETPDQVYHRGVDLLTATTDALYLGRGMLYPIALEGALKLKEISYLHAEGYPGGEMKHGPIALVDDGFPVVAVAPRTPAREKLLGNLREVQTRGAAILAVAEAGAPGFEGLADLILPIPDVDHFLQPVVSVIPLQLLAYYVAVELGLDVDQPRNLAKSVTVE